MHAAITLVDAFVSHLSPEVQVAWVGVPDLSARLTALYDDARAAWPTVEVAPQAFIAHVARHVPAGALPEGTLGGLHCQDLYLAAACLNNSTEGIKIFEQNCVTPLTRGLSHMNLSVDLLADLQQELRVRLLVGHAAKPPKLVTYAGRGKLESWVMAAAVKLALNWLASAGHRKRVDVSDEGLLLDRLVGTGDSSSSTSPEDAYVRGTYREYAQNALSKAFRQLERDQRNLLRMYYLDQLLLEEIGFILGMHKATVSRRLSAAREQILQTMRQELQHQLAASASVVDTLLAELRSQLDLSLSALLRTSIEDSDGDHR